MCRDWQDPVEAHLYQEKKTHENLTKADNTNQSLNYESTFCFKNIVKILSLFHTFLALFLFLVKVGFHRNHTAGSETVCMAG